MKVVVLCPEGDNVLEGALLAICKLLNINMSSMSTGSSCKNFYWHFNFNKLEWPINASRFDDYTLVTIEWLEWWVINSGANINGWRHYSCLPNNWVIRRDEFNYKFINHWANKILDSVPTFSYRTGNIYFDGKKPDVVPHKGKRSSDYMSITFEQFEKYVLDQPKQEEKMVKNVVNLTRAELIKLYTSFGCTEWQNVIMMYLEKLKICPDTYKIEIQPYHIQLLLQRGSIEQKRAVKDLGVILEPEDKNAMLRTCSYKRVNEFSKELFDSEAVMNIVASSTAKTMNRGDLANRALWISPFVDVVLHSVNQATVIEFKKKS